MSAGKEVRVPARFRIVAAPGHEPPYILELDPRGIVCLAEAVTTALEARSQPPPVPPEPRADAADKRGEEKGIRAAAAWLRRRGISLTADALLEELLP